MIFAIEQHFLQDNMCAQGRLGSACVSRQSDQSSQDTLQLSIIQGSKVSSSSQQRVWAQLFKATLA